MNLPLQNNFESLKEDFKRDTGLEIRDHMQTYIQYYNARMNDQTSQLISLVLKEVADHFENEKQSAAELN